MKHILPLSFVATLAVVPLARADNTNSTSDIVVTAPYVRDRLDVLQSTSVLSGDQLHQALRGTLGETLARLPGVSSTSFGPGVSRPVLRGLQGERLRILIDGLGSIDVSNTSADHAVALEPEDAKRIEVLRGPSTLLYGASAIGGVVNEVDDRIPLEKPQGLADGWISGLYATASDTANVAGGITAILAPRLVVHAGGSYYDTSDLRIGGFTESRFLRAEEEEEAGGEAIDHPRGRLANSDVTNASGSLGSTLLFDQGYFGASVSYLDSEYGIPGGHEGDVRIALDQVRVDVKGGVSFSGGFLESAKLRFGWADYAHKELEGTEVGTQFKNQGYEGRLEFVQRAQGAWRGAFGIQYQARDFEALGEEAFVPANQTSQFSAFVLQEGRFGHLSIEGALRYEHTDLAAQDLNTDRSFDTLSGSLGASIRLDDAWRLGVSVSRVTRTPAAEELFANGPHAATNTFEIGDPSFRTERAWGVEAWVRASTDRTSLNITAFWNRFDRYIYEQDTGQIIEDLPVFQFIQTNAEYYGIEFEGTWTFAQTTSWSFVADIVGDYVRATNLIDGRPLPRIPAKRLLAGLEAQSDALKTRAEVELVDDQNRISAFERPTDGYVMVNLSLSWKPWKNERDVTLTWQANNLSDAVGRRHASFLKDVAPLAGRDFRFHVRVGF